MFRRDVWDPVLILCQIIALQSFYYTSLCLFFYVGGYVGGYAGSLDQFFTESIFDDIYNINTICTVITYWCTAVALAFGMVLIVERAKKVLDFAFTVHMIHLICTCFYRQNPVHWEWWITMIISILVSTLCGEYLCMKQELRAIKRSEITSTIRAV